MRWSETADGKQAQNQKGIARELLPMTSVSDMFYDIGESRSWRISLVTPRNPFLGFIRHNNAAAVANNSARPRGLQPHSDPDLGNE
jgi:hypothetical protein